MSGGPRPDTWMPLYIGDYLADTMHLSHAQHGIYLMLIMAYWRNGGPLPDDAGQLSAIAKCSAADWRKHLPIIARFFQISGGVWAHKRIDAELEGAMGLVAERREAGRRGGLAARGKSGRPPKNSSAISGEAENDAPGNSKPNSKPNSKKIANEWQKNTPSPSPEEEDSDPRGSGADAPADPVKAIWDRGLAILGNGQRALLGKLRKTYGDPVLLAAIVSCESECPSEPVAFLVACCERSKTNGKGSAEHDRAVDILGRAGFEFDERQGRVGPAETPH